MGERHSLARELAAIGALTAALALVKHDSLGDPFTWDALGYEAPSVFQTLDGSFLHPGHFYNGHPPTYTILLAAAWKLSPGFPLLHLVTLALAALALVYTYKLGAWAYGPVAGFGAALMLGCNQLFFAQIGTLNLTTPTLAFSVVAAYFYLRRRPGPYVVAGVLCVLCHLSAWVAILGCCMHWAVVSGVRRDVREFFRGAWVAAPALALGAWLLHHGLSFGWFAPHNQQTEFYAVPASLILLRTFVFDCWTSQTTTANWIASLAITVAVVQVALRRRWRGWAFMFLVAIAVQLTLLYVADVGEDHGPHPVLEMAVWLTGISTVVLAWPLGVAASTDARLSASLLCGTTTLALVPLLARGFILPRYPTPLLPYFFVVGSFAFVAITARFRLPAWSSLVPVGAVCALSVLHFHTHRATLGFYLETNMDYRDVMESEMAVAKYLDTHAGMDAIQASFPLDVALRDPRYGYVSRALNVAAERGPTVRYVVGSAEAPQFTNPGNDFHLVARFGEKDWAAVFARK